VQKLRLVSESHCKNSCHLVAYTTKKMTLLINKTTMNRETLINYCCFVKIIFHFVATGSWVGYFVQDAFYAC
jgi:hypothetical protein